MIKVYFPPGCYGTYVARCIYNYTNLRNEPFNEFTFSNNGDSHQHRDNLVSKLSIKQGHIETLDSHQDDVIVSILPCKSNRLDYHNNQFFKHQHGKLIEFISARLSPEVAQDKLKTQWNYHGKFDKTVPKWIMREWCSFWINDVLTVSYNPTPYQELNSVAQLTTRDIFENYIERLTEIVAKLELTFTVSLDIIHQQHENFLSAQKFHNSQIRCEQYVQDLLDGHSTDIVLYSIFDEAYIQHLLRLNNLELRCDGLDLFPVTTQQLRNLTYETLHNTD
jgi:hypothetical protein